METMETGLARYWALPLRIMIGLSFIHHGLPKVLSPVGHQQFQAMLGQLGVPAPALMAWVVGFVEFFGGIALVVGFFTWIAAALIAVDMLVALLLVHRPAGFDVVQVIGMSDRGPVFGLPGYELNLAYIAGLLALFIGGPGPLSVDERAPGETPLLAPWMHRRAHA
jgi:putative oxidoreductase